jgi:hypothetical protein
MTKLLSTGPSPSSAIDGNVIAKGQTRCVCVAEFSSRCSLSRSSRRGGRFVARLELRPRQNVPPPALYRLIDGRVQLVAHRDLAERLIPHRLREAHGDGALLEPSNSEPPRRKKDPSIPRT